MGYEGGVEGKREVVEREDVIESWKRVNGDIGMRERVCEMGKILEKII